MPAAPVLRRTPFPFRAGSADSLELESDEKMQPLLTIRVPGKVLLTGEYAVLDGAPAIAAAVSRFVECRALPSDKWEISGAGLTWQEGGTPVPGLNFACEALRLARLYLEGIGAKL